MPAAHLVTDALSRAGVKTVFSLSGNQIMPIYDACIDAGIRIVHVRHEAAAVYMADAWAQLTGEIGVALLTAAPGITNGLSPLYSARMAESPVLVLSGDSPLSADGMGAFQELAQTDITRPLVKHAVRCTRAGAMGSDVAQAITVALSGRPGPVHVALPFDLLQQEVAETDAIRPHVPRRQRTELPADRAQAIVRRLAAASRPLVLVGPMQNASRAGDRLRVARQALQAPVVPMESPRGLRDPSLGAFAGVLAEADLVVLLGKPLDFTVAHGRRRRSRQAPTSSWWIRTKHWSGAPSRCWGHACMRMRRPTPMRRWRRCAKRPARSTRAKPGWPAWTQPSPRVCWRRRRMTRTQPANRARRRCARRCRSSCGRRQTPS